MLIPHKLKLCLVCVLSFALAGCFGSSSKPQLVICEELDDTEEWIEPAIEVQQLYGTPIALTLVLLELPLSELDKPHVRPRAADWDEFRIRTERWGADPVVVEDAVHFLGWFTRETVRRNNVSWNNASEHYLALRLGHGEYHRLQANKYPQLAQQALAIQYRHDSWQRELHSCKDQWQGESWYHMLKLW